MFRVDYIISCIVSFVYLCCKRVTFALQMYEHKYDNDVNGLRMDYIQPEKISGYRLSRDKKLLSYIYTFFHCNISYVCFLSQVYSNGQSCLNCDVISVRNIPILLKYLKDYYIQAGSVFQLYSHY